ncbi:MAG: TetR/AcrR family transcriptional regulator [Actinobacteria bacterium]|nr:TetR/AcrR family transcriptional regulator [Actinomycetota bacterium]
MSNKTTVKDKRVSAAERREIILEAALSVFADHGYEGARVNEIASRADVTRPILYRHFPSKLSMLIALVDRAGESLVQAMSEAPSEDLNWRDSIRHDVRAYLDFVERYGKGYNLLYFGGAVPGPGGLQAHLGCP